MYQIRRAFLLAATVAATIVTQAHAARDWHLREGAISCPSYFNMTEAEAALPNNATWFLQTGCAQNFGRPRVILLDPLSDMTVRVRLIWSDQIAHTAYVRKYHIMGYANKTEVSAPDILAAESKAAMDRLLAEQRAH